MFDKHHCEHSEFGLYYLSCKMLEPQCTHAGARRGEWRENGQYNGTVIDCVRTKKVRTGSPLVEYHAVIQLPH